MFSGLQMKSVEKINSVNANFAYFEKKNEISSRDELFQFVQMPFIRRINTCLSEPYFTVQLISLVQLGEERSLIQDRINR